MVCVIRIGKILLRKRSVGTKVSFEDMFNLKMFQTKQSGFSTRGHARMARQTKMLPQHRHSQKSLNENLTWYI